MMKRLYHMLAMLALINLFTLAGLFSYLVGTGRLTAKSAGQIAMVLRGEFPEEQVAATQPAEIQEKPETSSQQIARVQDTREYLELMANRHQRETRDRATLDQKIQLETRRLLEKLEEQKRQFKMQKEAVLEEGGEVGFEKQLEMISTIEPKLARDLLQDSEDADTVRILMQMDDNRAKKIINACKTDAEKAWIGRIMTQMAKFSEETDTPPLEPAGGS